MLDHKKNKNLLKRFISIYLSRVAVNQTASIYSIEKYFLENRHFFREKVALFELDEALNDFARDKDVYMTVIDNESFYGLKRLEIDGGIV